MKLQVSNSPHIRDNITTTSIMRDVIIALIPATAFAVCTFGLRALLMVLVSVFSCMFFEWISRIIMKRNNTLSDLSAAVTGLLLGLNLPPTIPLYMIVIGAFFAIVVVKQFFGGLGNNFVNPALSARIFLVIAFPAQMTLWTVKESAASLFSSLSGADLVTTATPLSILHDTSTLHGSVPLTEYQDSLPSLLSLFMGDQGGCIGEISAFALIIGAAYLLIRKVISPSIPLAYLGSFTLFVLFFGHYPIYKTLSDSSFSLSTAQYIIYEPLYMLFSGGLILGAFFMATDYVTSPLTTRGRIIFGIGCGLLTFLIRYYANISGGVSFAIIIMNILTPHIDKITRHTPYGGKADGRA